MPFASILNRVTGQPPSYYKKSHYKFGEALGAGAFGLVRRAQNIQTGEEVAIKVILRHKLKGHENALFSELAILRQLKHPHIVKLRDYFESRDKIYIVTELCTGGELFDRICNEGRFSEQDVARNFTEIVAAVKYLHDSNIVHRDIKPENLLFRTNEDDSDLMLCDFGIACPLESSDELIMHSAGSLGYAAPEVFTGVGHSKPCDIWSLGVVLFTSLSGYSPFVASSPAEFMTEVGPGFRIRFHEKYWRDVSREAKDLIRWMLQYDPKDRPTVDQILHDKWLTGATNEYDLLPTIRQGLSARSRWKLAFERIRLAKRIQDLGGLDDSGDDVPATPGNKFHEVVVAAQRNKTLLDEAATN